MRERRLGNVLYYSWANGLKEEKKVKRLSHDIQKVMGGIPALIAVDQEGGVVSRLRGEFTQFPGNRALAMAGQPHFAQEAALAMGKEMGNVGIRWNLAPVVDIDSCPDNPVIGIRSFGQDPKTVITFAREALEGYRRADILTSLKHFPGHGDTHTDSHTSIPQIDLSLEELVERELAPFAALKREADAIMSAHILLPKIDRERVASLLRLILTDLLRKEMGFNGVILSDSLTMRGAVLCQRSSEETLFGITQAAIQAFNAGSDCLLLGRVEGSGFDREINAILIKEVLSGFKRAVLDGAIAEKRLDESLKAMFKLKQKVLLVKEDARVDYKRHRALAKEIADRALRLASPQELLKGLDTKLKGRRIALILPDRLEEMAQKALSGWPSVRPLFLREGKMEGGPGELEEADLILFGMLPGAAESLNQLLDKYADKLILIGLSNPGSALPYAAEQITV